MALPAPVAGTLRGTTPRDHSTGTLRHTGTRKDSLSSPKKSPDLILAVEDEKEKFIRKFETVVADVYKKGCEILEKIGTEDKKKYISQHFCSERKIRKSALPIVTINKIILTNHQIFKKELPNDFADRTAIPDGELDRLTELFGAKGDLKNWSRFERHFVHITPLDSSSTPTTESNYKEKRETALRKLKKLKYEVFPKHNNKENARDEENKVKILPEVRKAVFELYKKEPQIGKEALTLLVDLLECDPIHEDSALYLVELQGQLREEIQSKNAEKLNVPLQRLLMRAYAGCLDCILLHFAAQNLNAITEDTRREVWKAVSSELISLNANDDIQIKDYAAYSHQAVQHITTDMNTFKKVATSILDVIKALIKVGGIYGDASQAPELLSGAVTDIKNAFRFIGRIQDWFGQVLFLKKACKCSLNNPTTFRKIADQIKLTLNQNCEDNYLYGLINILTFVIINSKSPEIQEETFKILISIDNPKCTSRLINALAQLINSEGKVGNTAKVIIQLQKHCGKLPEKEVESIDDSTHKLERQQSSRILLEVKKPAMLHMKDAYLMNVVIFQLRRLGQISDNQDFGGHTLATMLITSEDNILPSLLECLKKYSNELMQPNAFGKTPYHIAAAGEHAKSIEHFYRIVHKDLNPKEYETGNTPLHLAAATGHEESVRTLLRLGADPYEVNYERSTALHLAAAGNHFTIAKLLLEKMVNGANQINSQGCSALNVAINLDNVDMFIILNAANVKPAERSASMTLIRIAARKGSEKVLRYLISLPNTALTLAEQADISKTKVGFNPLGFPRTPVVKMLPSPSVDLSRKKNEKEQPKVERAPSLADIRTQSKGGNHALIEFARSTDSLKDLKKLQGLQQLLNEPNYDGLTPIHTAVICDKKETVQGLLDQGCDPKSNDIRNFTPLHFAALLQRVAIVKLILGDPKGKDTVTAINDHNETPLHLACGFIQKRTPDSISTVHPNCYPPTGDCVDLIEQLIAAGSDPYHTDIAGNTILHRAFAYAGFPTVNYLLQRFPKLFWMKNLEGKLPIQYGIHFKNMNTIRDYFQSVPDMLALNKELIEKTKNEVTLANLLIKARLMDRFKALLDLDESIATHVDSTPKAQTPLHYAAIEGLNEVLEVYIQKNIPLTATDKYGNTIAHYIVNLSQYNMLESLKAHPIIWTIPNQDKHLPLHMAAKKGSVETVRFIIKTGAKDNPDGHGNTSLHFACQLGRGECIKELSKLHEEDLDVKNDDGNTPFGFACMSGINGLDVSNFIAKADIEWINNYGTPPLLLAAAHGSIDTLNKILAAEVDIHRVDHQGENALHKGCFKGNLEVVQALKNFEDDRVVRQKLADMKDTHGEIPIMELAKKPKRNTDIDLRIFKELKGSSNLQTVNTNGESILHLACFHGHEHLFKPILEEEKTLIGKTDNHGNTPFHKACIGNHRQFIELFDKADKDLRSKENNDGQTPFLLAVRLGHIEFAQAVRRKEEARKTDKENRTLFHLLLGRPMLEQKHLDFLDDMLKEYPDLIFEKDKQKRTVLHIIAEQGHSDAVVQKIYNSLNGGPKQVAEFINAQNTSDCTAAQVAHEKGYLILERKLRNPPISSLGINASKNKRHSASKSP